jgi:hypothetical protein
MKTTTNIHAGDEQIEHDNGWLEIVKTDEKGRKYSMWMYIGDY